MKKLTRQWIRHAGDDLQSARALLREEIHTMACFHSQQCVEKSLKAILQEKEVTIPRIHNIKILKDMVENTIRSFLDLSPEGANFLSQVYVESRYPLDIGLLPYGEPTKEDAEKALDIAERIFTEVGKILQQEI